MKHRRELNATFLHFVAPAMPTPVGARAGLDLAKGCPVEFYPDPKSPMAVPLHRADGIARKRALMRWDRSPPRPVEVEHIQLEQRIAAAVDKAGDEAAPCAEAAHSSKALAHARRVPAGAAMRVLG